MERLRTMNPEQAASLFRTVLQVVGAILVGSGWTGEAQVTVWGGAALTILTTVWGVWARSDSNLLISAANVPGVKAVLVPSAVANAIPDPKVTAREPFQASMSVVFLALFLPVLLLLPACADVKASTGGAVLDLTTTEPAAKVTPANPEGALAKVDAGILKGSNAVAQFCGELKIAATGLDLYISKPEQQRVLDDARVGLNTFCLRPPRDVPSAILTLGQIWLNIRAVRAEAGV